jgi:tRNA (adenine22-N1)-methyltransferase
MQKLNARLTAIFNTIPEGYDAIWDCCCDHGYLGMFILQAKLCRTVYFVDQVASITDALQKKLHSYGAVNYAVITDSAANLKLDDDKKHLIILAGISGNTAIHIMQGLQALNPHSRIGYILSPNYQILAVREYLAGNNFCLIHEELVFENGQNYEVIYVSGAETGEQKIAVTLTGNMWDMHNAQHQQYLDKLIVNYKNKILKNPENNKEDMLDRYLNIKTSMCNEKP